MSQPATAQIIPFPRRDQPSADERLVAALAEQHAALTEWQAALDELAGSLGHLAGSLRSLDQALATSVTR